MRFVRALAIPILIASLAGTVAACGGEPAASGDVVKIGTTESAPEWDVFKRKAAEQVRERVGKGAVHTVWVGVRGG